MEEEIAKIIYEAKKKNAWGNWQSQYREDWPANDKELRKRRHHGDCCLEFAFAQARAVIKHLKI